MAKGKQMTLEGENFKIKKDRVEQVDDVAFDEMNLVELPFALLTDAKEARSKPVMEIALGPDGTEALVASARSSVPTALAERVVLGLMWLTQQENTFKEPVVRFPLRKLVEHFMYPDRFSQNRASGAFMQRVEEEINRVADTRIHSDRWYDKELGKQTKMNAAIIDYIQVVHEGGRNSARIVEIRWGAKLFKSVQARYTKALDVRTLLRIDRPLDLRFYRWLDRQLGTKDRETVASCQNFARYKLLMRGQKINRGGRTASSYIVRKLKEALTRLNDIGFSVRMTVDESQSDFRLMFEKIKGRSNESVAVDNVADLVRLFQRKAHGLPKSAPKRAVSAGDRADAERWLNDYGHDQAVWLVNRSLELHKRSRQKEETLFKFKALSFYEAKAMADWEKKQVREVKGNQPGPQSPAESVEEAWEAYRFAQVEKARKTLSAKAMAVLEEEAKVEVEQEMSNTRFKTPKSALKAILQGRVEEHLMVSVGASTEDEFFSQWKPSSD